VTAAACAVTGGDDDDDEEGVRDVMMAADGREKQQLQGEEDHD
jgi:hypothetical protein